MTETEMHELKFDIMSGEIGINEARKLLGLPPIEGADEIQSGIAKLHEKTNLRCRALGLKLMNW